MSIDLNNLYIYTTMWQKNSPELSGEFDFMVYFCVTLASNAALSSTARACIVSSFILTILRS